MANINTGDLSNFPEPDDVDSTNKHLWYLLMGDSRVANEDVVHEELKRNCNKILSALTFYPRRPPVTSNNANNVIGIETASGNEKAQSKTENSSGEPSTASDFKTKPVETNKEAEKRLRSRLAKVLDLEESIAWEIFCSYMMFEYKGKATTYVKIMETELYVVAFLKDIRSFYMRERLCLIYCSQIILAEATNENNQYSDIFSSFVQSSSLDSWVKWLCASFDEAVNEVEQIALLHTLAILIFHYSQHAGVVEAFVNHYKILPRGPKSQDIIEAEAILYFCVTQCGDPKEAADNASIEAFVEENVISLMSNPYSMTAVLGSLMIRFPANQVIKNKVKEIGDPEKCIPSLLQLTEAYDKNSFKNRYGLSSMIFRCLYNTMDIILRLLNKENFGTPGDWYFLLSKLLRDKDIAAEFLGGNSSDIVNLYLEALVQFPIESSPIMLIWGSICEAVSETSTCTAVLAQLTEIKYIAEYADSIDPYDLRFLTDNDRVLLEQRVVAGVPVKAGLTGTLVEDTSPPIIFWILDPPCTTTTVWDIIYGEIINPVLVAINEGGRISEILSDPNSSILSPTQASLVLEIAEFLATFGRASRAIPPRMFELYRPTCFILSVLVNDSKRPNTKADYAGLLLRLVDSGSKFNEALFPEFLTGIWPSQSIQNVAVDLIIGYESVMSSNYALTLGLLTATLGIVTETDIRKTPISPQMKEFFTQSVLFVVENIFQAYDWVIPSENAKNKIMCLCLKILYSLFHLKEAQWNSLKMHCIRTIVDKHSALLSVLGKNEELLQDSIIKPTLENEKLPDIIYYSLSLLLEMMTFDKTVAKTLDRQLNLTLPQKIARFARHRLSTKIPTLAINLLGKIAQEINLSLLSSFGNESDSFRDILIQRLEFKSEDIHLKIAILEFLNICVHMQNGLIEHFLYDDSVLERLLELVNEKDENIQLAALSFLRAMFRKGTMAVKRVKHTWAMISEPIKHLDGDSSLKIATMTFNIFSFEAYNNGVGDANFQKELINFLQKDNIQKIIILLMEPKGNEEMEKCLAALKHLLTILFSKLELSGLVPKETKSMLMDEVYKRFWSLQESNGCKVDKRVAYLGELLLHLCPTEDSEFLDDLASKMYLTFSESMSSVRTSLLSIANSCIKNGKGEISVRAVDNLVKIICQILFNSNKVFEAPDSDRIFPVLSIAASTVSSLVSSNRCYQAEKVYRRHYLASAVAHTVYLGITHGAGVQVVLECLGALIRMATKPETSRMVQYCGLVKTIWLPISQDSAKDGEECEQTKAWHKVYSLCIHLNTCLLSSLKFYYLEDCLNFWGILGQFLISKLWGLCDLTNRSLLTNTEKNFKDLKDILMFDVFILNQVSTLSPYFDVWKKNQACELSKIIEGVYVTLRTTAGLLSQPNHLMILISKPYTRHSFDFKLTPQLLEVQTKMWDVIALAVHIFCRLKTQTFRYVDPEQLHNTMHSVAQLCLRALTKSDRKSHLSINVSQRIIMTLEKTMTVLYIINQYVTAQAQETPVPSSVAAKPTTLLLREMAAEMTMLCDNIRRLSSPKSEFLLMLCTYLEPPFK